MYQCAAPLLRSSTRLKRDETGACARRDRPQAPQSIWGATHSIVKKERIPGWGGTGTTAYCFPFFISLFHRSITIQYLHLIRHITRGGDSLKKALRGVLHFWRAYKASLHPANIYTIQPSHDTVDKKNRRNVGLFQPKSTNDRTGRLHT